jgi:hypothetical protein
MKYRFHEGSLEVPEDWRDESMNIFKAAETEGFNLVVSREKIPRSVDPQAHVAAQRRIIEDNLMGFRERERATIVLGGSPCVWLEYSWQSPEGPMNQVNVMCVAGDTLVSFTFTSAGTFNDGQRGAFRRLLESFELAEAARAA